MSDTIFTAKYNMPFKVQILDSEPVKVTNQYSGASVMLTPQAVAVYDVIRGAEIIGNDEAVRKGLDWFIHWYPEEYMILLD